MFYTRLHVICAPDFLEILIAEIADAGFDSFLEVENGFEAYAESGKFDRGQLRSVLEKYSRVSPLSFFEDLIEKRNWNEDWEKSFEPVVVEGTCIIRAEFHKVDEDYPYEIVITPKMSFGTGHHQTTYLMIKNQLTMDHKDKRVMDAGCGTAVLSIMAAKRGAAHVEAFDIDEWSIDNAMENIGNNHCSTIHLQQAKIGDLVFDSPFEIILANINKNVLLDEIPAYARLLTQGGQLLLSGFYFFDIDDILRCASACSLSETRRDERDTWASLLLLKE